MRGVDAVERDLTRGAHHLDATVKDEELEARVVVLVRERVALHRGAAVRVDLETGLDGVTRDRLREELRREVLAPGALPNQPPREKNHRPSSVMDALERPVCMARARHRQTEIVFRSHGGKRRGAGRKPAGERAAVSHATRDDVSSRAPVLVTLKMKKRVWNLRTKRAFTRLVPAFLAVCERFGMRLVHYSVQGDHIHLIVEAEDRRALARSMQSLCVRIARALNEMMQTTGGVFADRYHHRVLATPRQVRAAVNYVLLNARHHGQAPRQSGWLDPFSSALAFEGWRGGLDARQIALARVHPPPVARPRTWLLATGWKRAGGLLDPEHRPGPVPA